MSICITVKVPDGLVLGTDSVAQLTGRLSDGTLEIAKTYNNARRLFQVGESMGIMAFGVGNLGTRSVDQSVVGFLGRSTDQRRVGAFANSLCEFMKTRYAEAYPANDGREQPEVGFFVSGYSEGARSAEEWEFVLPNAEKARPVRDLTAYGSVWRGVSTPMPRLYEGFDARIPEQLLRLGVSQDIVSQVFNEQWKLSTVYDGMPIQDALNLGTLLLNTAIGAAAFEKSSTSSCGGPLQVAVIQPSEGWTWITRPSLAVTQ
ncbi:MAG: hypothetical protein IH957_00555 [Chloroflexi bacterium]|nr:hypothetical protein [Chloroflexota bacterium]